MENSLLLGDKLQISSTALKKMRTVKDMKKRILDYLQLSLQGTGIAALGTLSIFEPKLDTMIFGCTCLLCGLVIVLVNRSQA